MTFKLNLKPNTSLCSIFLIPVNLEIENQRVLIIQEQFSDMIADFGIRIIAYIYTNMRINRSHMICHTN